MSLSDPAGWTGSPEASGAIMMAVCTRGSAGRWPKAPSSGSEDCICKTCTGSLPTAPAAVKQDQLRCNCSIHRRLSEPRRQERPVLARQLYAIHRRRRGLPAPHFLPRRTAGIIRVADAPHKTGETEPEVKSPQHTPHQPHANTARYAFPLVRSQILGSRDRTRTYNLPVNRRSVAAGAMIPGRPVQASSPALLPLEALSLSFYQSCRRVPGNAVLSVLAWC
jgi:hypothetical protein